MSGPGRRPVRESRVLRTLGATIAVTALAVATWLLFVEPEERPAAVEEEVEPEAAEREPEPDEAGREAEAPTPEAPGPPAPEPEPPPRAAPGAPTAPFVQEPEIGPVQRGIEARLRAADAPVRPLRAPARFLIEDLVWDDTRDRPFFRASSVRGLIELDAAVAGDVVLPALTLVEPVAVLERGAADEEWNYQRVLAGLLDGTDDDAAGPGARPRVVARDVRVQNGRVTVRPPDAAEPYVLRDITALFPRVVVSEPGLEAPLIQAARLDATFSAPGLAEPAAVELADAQVRLPDGRLVFAFDRLAADETVVADARGTWTPDAPGLGLRLEARVSDLPLERVQPFVPELPPQGLASFRLVLEPLAGARTAVRIDDLAAQLEEGRVGGSLRLVIGPDAREVAAVDLDVQDVPLAAIEQFTGALPYAGLVTGRITGDLELLQFDVSAQLLVPEAEGPVAVDLVGRFVPGVDGLELQRLEAQLQDVPLAALAPLAPGLPTEGVVTGRVEIAGPPGRAPLTVDVSLALAGGRVAVQGTLDLSGALPAYDLTGRFIGVQLAALLVPDVPPVALTADFAIVGSGTDPTAMDAQFSLAGEFRDWRAGPGDGVRLRGTLDDGVVGLETADIRLATLTLEAAGVWDFVAPPAGELDYRLAVDSLAPFGPYIPYLPDAPVSGALATRGALSGTLEAPTFIGAATAEELVYAGWSAETVDAEYTVDVPLPSGLDLRVAAEAVETPTEAAFATATLEAQVERRSFRIAFDAERQRDAGPVELRATGSILSADRRVARLEVLRFDLDGGEWSLVEPARIRWGGEPGVTVRGLVVQEVEGDGRIALDGPIPPAADAVLTVELAALPLREVLLLAGQDTTITGELWAEAEVIGPPAAPVIDAEFRLLDAAVRAVEVDAFEGTLAYADDRLRTQIDAVVDTMAAGGTLDVRASLPVALSLRGPPFVRPLDAGALRASIRADRFPLRVLEPLSPEVRDPEGFVNADVTLMGSMAEPVYDGRIAVLNGAVTLPAFNQRYTEITGEITLEDQRAVVQELRARSDGLARVSGTIRFADAMAAEADLEVLLERFRPIGVEGEDDAAAWGELRVTGPLASPLLSGSVRLDEGALPIPGADGVEPFEEDLGDGLDLGAEGALAADDGALPADGAVVDDGIEPLDGDAGPPGPLAPLRLEEVQVEAGDDLWFVSERVRVQLSGEVTVFQTAGELTALGSLSGEEGTFTLVAGPLVRWFEISSAEVRFFGTPDVDPAIDVEATHTVYGPDGEPIDIVVAVQGTLERPQVALSLPDGAEVPQSELLSLVLFGRPTFALGEGAIPGQQVLEEVVVGGLFGTAFLELEQLLLTDLGLPFDYLRVRPGPGEFGGFGAPMIVLGREIADDVFLTVDTGVSTLFGETSATQTWGVSVRWRIDPEWTLEAGLEPVFPAIFLPGGPLIAPVQGPDRQFYVDLRRRWTY